MLEFPKILLKLNNNLECLGLKKKQKTNQTNEQNPHKHKTNKN